MNEDITMQDNAGNSWGDLGRDIGQTVQNAISSGNYSSLNGDISRIMNKTVSNIGNSISKAQNRNRYSEHQSSNVQSNPYAQGMPGQQGSPYPQGDQYTQGTTQAHAAGNTMHDIHGRDNKGYSEFQSNPEWQSTKTYQYINRINNDHVQDAAMKQQAAYQSSVPVLYQKLSVNKALAITGMVAGYSIGGILALISAGFIIVAAVTGHAAGAAVGFGIPALAGIFGGLAAGVSYNRMKRFDIYLQALGTKTYADLKTLASSIGKSVSYVKKDLTGMFRRGWFLQGHMDDQGTCLITSDETYKQYQVTQEERKAIAAKTEAEEAEISKLSPEAKQMIEQGGEFLKEIHKCNDDIPGEEISAKIDRMENSVHKIFERAKEHPEVIGDLRKMMSYYLPTTVKLLKAYADMDRQPIQGENIVNSKKEIESTIDTLNDAFDKLFDSLFQDTNMDVSTDAAVMKTMLAQEGLTGHDFTSTDTMKFNQDK